jgi:hypothetical protein
MNDCATTLTRARKLKYYNYSTNMTIKVLESHRIANYYSFNLHYV